MSIRLISCKCPDCRQRLEIIKERKQVFCSYCRARVLIQNHHPRERVFLRIEEAGILKTETERLVRLKELKLEEKWRNDLAWQHNLETVV